MMEGKMRKVEKKNDSLVFFMELRGCKKDANKMKNRNK